LRRERAPSNLAIPGGVPQYDIGLELILIGPHVRRSKRRNPCRVQPANSRKIGRSRLTRKVTWGAEQQNMDVVFLACEEAADLGLGRPRRAAAFRACLE
jgi:hypothetical protein